MPDPMEQLNKQMARAVEVMEGGNKRLDKLTETVANLQKTLRQNVFWAYVMENDQTAFEVLLQKEGLPVRKSVAPLATQGSIWLYQFEGNEGRFTKLQARAMGEMPSVWLTKNDPYAAVVVGGANPPITQLALNAVTAVTAGTAIETRGHYRYTIFIISASVTTGGTVVMEGSMDGTNWATISTNSIVGNGTTVNSNTPGGSAGAATAAFRYIRGRLSVRTDGTYTVYLHATGAGTPPM